VFDEKELQQKLQQAVDAGIIPNTEFSLIYEGENWQASAGNPNPKAGFVGEIKGIVSTEWYPTAAETMLEFYDKLKV
jgi:hypothetical protein